MIVYLHRIARVAQLVELQPSKLTVAGSSPVSRSKKTKHLFGFFYFNLFPNNNNKTIGTPSNKTIVLFCMNTSGYNNNIKA